jgi:PPP family 3-phenylpropionic acid transporter
MFLVACGSIQAAHATYYAFGSIHWTRQGLSAELIGALWALGVFAEIVLFAWSGAVYQRLSAGALMVIGGAASVVRWAMMAVDPGFGVLVLLQVLHALTFGASHLAAIRFISLAVDAKLAGTAQALYATIAMGVAMGGATLASGVFYEKMGGSTFFLMAGLAGIGLIAAFGVVKFWGGGLLTDAQPKVEFV